MPSRPRVLAFVDVCGSLVAECRAVAPLEALASAGLIESFTLADASLRDVPQSGAFDVVWLQRGADAWLARTLAERLPNGYLMDVDDHLLCRPSYLRADDLPDPAALIAALRGCRVLTTPSVRLRRLLESRAGLDMAGRAHVCVNAVPFRSDPIRPPGLPRAILLAQSHRLALTVSRGEVLAALVEAAARHGLPLWTIGAFPDGVRAAAGAAVRVERLSPRSWGAYHRALAGPPTLLGLAPLETHGDVETLEFIAGKSDIKMAEYGGFGHPAVYSDAPPYRDTDLACGRVVENSHAAWSSAIDDLMKGGWHDAASEAFAVREARDLARIAEEQWWPAITAARLENPVRAASLFSALDRARARARDRAARARWRLHQGA